MNYKIESDYPLNSDFVPKEYFKKIYTDRSAAVATAIEGVYDPSEQEVRVVCVETGDVIWRSTEEEFD